LQFLTGDFEVFHPAWVTCSTNYWQIWYCVGSATPCQILCRLGRFWGFLTRNTKNSKFCKLIRPHRGNSRISIEIYSFYRRARSTKNFTFGAIWCTNEGVNCNKLLDGTSHSVDFQGAFFWQILGTSTFLRHRAVCTVMQL